MMTTATIIPTTTRCCLRIVDDILDESKLVEIQRDKDSVLIDLLLMQKTVYKIQKAIRLCIHITHEVITLHWWTEDRDFTRLLIGMAEIPRTVLECLQRGEVWK